MLKTSKGFRLYREPPRNAVLLSECINRRIPRNNRSSAETRVVAIFLKVPMPLALRSSIAARRFISGVVDSRTDRCFVAKAALELFELLASKVVFAPVTPRDTKTPRKYRARLVAPTGIEP